MNFLGAVVIGRNEGDRLRLCLESMVGRCAAVVYVDSGSADGSVPLARSLGVEVVELERSLPFTAARARNAGFDRLLEILPDLRLVQFVDGDCEVVDGWLDRGMAELETHASAAVVCGRLRERHPGRSVYNQLADIEWDTPIGEVRACGGVAMVRAEGFLRVGGFDPTIASGEEPDLCHRLLLRGWTILRVDAEMALHDLGMTSIRQWWRRQVRGGYGSLDVATRHGGGAFAHQVRSARLWTAGWLLGLGAGGLAGSLIGPAAAAAVAGALAAIPFVQAIRLATRARPRLPGTREALAYGALTVIGKWAEGAGQILYLRDRLAGRRARLIEHKIAATAVAGQPS